MLLCVIQVYVLFSRMLFVILQILKFVSDCPSLDRLDLLYKNNPEIIMTGKRALQICGRSRRACGLASLLWTIHQESLCNIGRQMCET